jgi:hypothetical protein
MVLELEAVWFCADHITQYADGELKVCDLVLSHGVWAPILSVCTVDERSAVTSDLRILGLVRLGSLPVTSGNAYPLPFGTEHSSISNKFLLTVGKWSGAAEDAAGFMPRILKTLATLLRSLTKAWKKNPYRKERTAAVAGKRSTHLGNFIFAHEISSEADVSCKAPTCCDQPIECPVRSTHIRFPLLCTNRSVTGSVAA